MLNLSKPMKLSLAIITAAFLIGSVSLHADCCGKSKPINIKGETAPEVKKKVRTNHPFPYRSLYQNLTRDGNIDTLNQDVIHLYQALAEPGTPNFFTAYNNLFDDALNIANSYCPAQPFGNVRVVVTATNGALLVDTQAGPVTSTAQFLEQIFAGENFNTRVAIFDAQAWPGGVGLETQLDFSNNKRGSAVAIRLGPYLNNNGTVRLSIFQ